MNLCLLFLRMSIGCIVIHAWPLSHVVIVYSRKSRTHISIRAVSSLVSLLSQEAVPSRMRRDRTVSEYLTMKALSLVNDTRHLETNDLIVDL